MSDPTVVEATMVTRVLRFMQGRGLDVGAALAYAGLQRSDAEDRDRLFPFRQTMRLYDHLMEVTGGSPAIGLEIATATSASDYGLLGLIWAHHPTLDAALDALAHYHNQFLASADIVVDRAADGTHVELTFDYTHPGLEAYLTEVLASILLHSRKAAPHGLTPLAARFRHHDPDPEPYTRLFGVPPTFGAPRDELVFASSDLSRPNPTADPMLLAHLLEAAETHLTRRQEAAVAQARLLRLQGATIDLRSGTVETARGVDTLTTKERAVLEYFAERPNQTITHQDLERDVWGIGRSVITHAPAVAIRRLRQKIEPTHGKPINLVTVFGEGWRLVVPGATGA